MAIRSGLNLRDKSFIDLSFTKEMIGLFNSKELHCYQSYLGSSSSQVDDN